MTRILLATVLATIVLLTFPISLPVLAIIMLVKITNHILFPQKKADKKDNKDNTFQDIRQFLKQQRRVVKHGAK